MKYIFTILLLLAVTYTGYGQYFDIKDKWDASYSIQGGLDVANIAFSSTGEVYVFGTNFTGGDHNAILVKYDANGNYQWEVAYSSLYGNSEDFAVKVAVDDDDNVFTVTNINPDDDQNASIANGFIIHKYNDEGTLVSEHENVNTATVKYGPKAYDFNLQHIIGDEPNYLYLATSREVSGGMGLEARLRRFDNSLDLVASSAYDSELDDIPLYLAGVTIYFKNNSTIGYVRWYALFENNEAPVSSTSGNNVGSTIDELVKLDRWYLIKLTNGQYHIQRGSTGITYDISYTLTDVYDTGSEMLLTGSKTVSGHEEMVLLVLNRDTGALIEEKVLDADHGTASSVGASVFIGAFNRIYVLGNVVEDGVQYPGLVTFDEDTYDQIDVSKYTSSASSPITHAYEGLNRDNILIGSSGSSTKIYTFCTVTFAISLGNDVFATIGETVVLKEGVDNRPNVTYEWSTGETTETISVTEDGTYSLTVYSEYGCPVSDEINVTFLAPAPGGPTLLEPVITSVDPISPVIQFSWKNDDPDAVSHVLAYDPSWNPNPGTYLGAYTGPNTSYDFEMSALADAEYEVVLWSQNSDHVGSSVTGNLTYKPCSEYDMSTLGTYLSGSSLNSSSQVTDEGGTFTYYLGGSYGPDLSGSFFDWDLPEGWEITEYKYSGVYIDVSIPPNGNSGEVGVRIINPCSGEATSYLTRQVDIIKDQTIDFPEPDATQVGATPFDLGASASSGLTVTYSANPTDIVDIVGGIVTPLKAGSVLISANQAGNEDWNAADAVQQTLTVEKAEQTITFAAIADIEISEGSVELDASASTGLQVSYSLISGDGTISGTTLTVNATGTFTIQATQSGNANYLAAEPVSRSFAVTDAAKTEQTIIFSALSDKIFGDGSFALTATADSDLTVTYMSSDESVATIAGSTVTIVGAGETIITASQTGDATYNPAPSVEQVLTVNKASQTITFAAIADIEISEGNVELDASASSGLAVSYLLIAGDGSIDDGTLTVNATGTFTVQASQAGDDNYSTAELVSRSFIVTDATKASQVITFNALDDHTYGDDAFALTATAGSGLAVTYTSSDESVATVAGSTVTILAVGSTTIIASQTGDATYNPAPSVEQVLTVNKADLSFEVEDVSIDEGVSLPAFTYSISGLVLGDTEADLDELPIVVASVENTDVAGVFDLQLSGGGDANYTYIFIDGKLTIGESILSTSENFEELQFYPNPANDVVTISSKMHIEQISLLNLKGKLLTTLPYNRETLKLDVSGLSAGVYLIEMKSEKLKIIKRLVVKH